MQLDYVDLLFCHRPDPDTPLEETVRAMAHLVNTGKVLYWGTSEWSAEELRSAHEIARKEHLIPPTMEQAHYNMFERRRVETEYLPLYESLGLGLTTFSPLLSGALSGKYKNGIPPGSRVTVKGYEWLKQKLESDLGGRTIEAIKRLEPLASDLGCTLAQLALAWCLMNPNVSTVITGASRPEQVRENMKAIGYVAKLTPDIMTRIDTLLEIEPRTATIHVGHKS